MQRPSVSGVNTARMDNSTLPRRKKTQNKNPTACLGPFVTPE